MDPRDFHSLAERIAHVSRDGHDAAAILADVALLLVRERVLSEAADATITPAAVRAALELRLHDPAAYARRVTAARRADPWMPRNRLPRTRMPRCIARGGADPGVGSSTDRPEGGGLTVG